MRFKFLKRTSSYFGNLFFKISLFSLAIIITLSFFLYFNFSNFGLEIINKSNEKLLSEIGSNAVQVNNYVKEYSYTLFLNENAVNLMLGNSITLFDAQNCLRKLDVSLAAVPFLYSAYFYNSSNEDTFYIIGPEMLIRKKEAFADKEVLSILDNISNYNILQPIARRISSTESTPNSTVDVYTYIIPELMFGNNIVKNALIVNIKADWMFNIINNSSSNNLSDVNDILIIDDDGNVLGDSQNNLYLSNISDKKHVKDVLNSSKTSGYFIDNVNNKKSVITYVTVESTKWRLLSITPYNYVLKPINEVKYITLFICIIILLFSLMSTFYLSKTLYSPIGNLRSEVEQLFGTSTSKDENLNEFELISKNFTSAFSRLSSLQSFKNNTFNLLKQKLLKDILLNKAESGKNLLIKCHEYGININEDSDFIALVFRIDHFLRVLNQLSESDQSLYRFALSNIASELIFQKYKCEAVDMGFDHIAIIIDLAQLNETTTHFIENASPLIKEIQEAYSKHYNLSLSVGIGHSCKGFRNLCNAYKSSLDASNYRICYDRGSILCAENLDKSQTEVFTLANSNIYHLLDALKKSKLEEIEKYFSAILTTLYKCKYNNIMYSLSYLTSSIFNTISNIEKNNIISFNLDFADFSSQITQLETLEEIKEDYFKLFHHIILKVMDTKDNKSAIIAENIIKYIHANYTDPNLSINTIASVLNLSTAYMGKLFREYTFQSVSDYINDYRLTKAQELLVNTDITIDEIIDRIKWENKNYFFTLFKKRFGATPTQYRLKMSVLDIQNSN